jgi:FtsZ-interacting cell division protein ZipA
MKATLISIAINIVLAILLVAAWNSCRDYKGKYREWRDKYEVQKQKADSLSSRAAIDCDQKIEKALNRSYEKDPNRPVKPALLR